MKAALTEKLIGDGPLAALVDDRIHWLALPEGEPQAPFVILQEISEREPQHLEGPTGLKFVRLQVDAWAETLAAAAQVADALEILLDGFAGVVSGIRFNRITKDMRRDLGPVDADGTRRLMRVSMDYEIVWTKEI